MNNILIIYYSSAGSTHQLAEAIAEGAAQHGQPSLLRIESRQIMEGRYSLQACKHALEQADAIIFGSPTYMGGPAAQFKSFADASSEAWCRQALAGKIAAGFTVGGSPNGDQQATLAYFATLAAQHGMLWCGLDIANGQQAHKLNRLGCQLGATAHCPDGTPHPLDLATARHLGERVARMASRLGTRSPAEAA
ncbi:flavodoxin family protein [Chromobacterium sp. IIBBL 290-4]|uniref:flavodoxin family protein n=1 Tax=Chromobacterium sp. IIBBL 290-4 TaxID=2953890 RepID=UPI0020B6AAE2|nr:flavodoxin family protein [Chromobacterium sp. IIBBL 290-4]UTH73681.1 flavodoxin family protein [Chromobacterium sp. IIBBL 290-4]